MTITLDSLAADIRARMEGLSESLSSQTSDERLNDLIRSNLTELITKDEEFARKMRFPVDGDRKLLGTKFARHGLSVADVEFAYDLLRAGKEAGVSKRGPSEELSNTFTALSEGRYMDTALVRQDGHNRLEAMWESGQFRSRADLARAQLAMDTAESGFGQQLIGAQYVGELWTGAQASARVWSLINSFTMTDPTAYLPVEAGLPELLYVGESTTFDAANYATTKTGSQRVQVDAKKFVMHQMWSGEMEEDSIIPFIPFLRRQAARSLAHHYDSLVLNGDTTNAATGNINLDDADPADTKHWLAFDGLRHAGLVDNTANSLDVAGAITLDHFKKQRARMLSTTYKHDWGHPNDPMDLVHVADPETADAIAFLDEVLTVDKFGPGATVLTGQQAKVLGNPLIASIDMSKTEADGKVSTTAANNTKGQVTTFNRNGAVVGNRRNVQVETERLPGSDQTRIVYSLRAGFGRFTPTGAASAIEWADVLYNISH
ncbi:phage major capsid protein [Nocardiopsis dassonvillei]|uniref:phage major capsid protein n=1 Tax=Nocardiopsis dassonvillei TaxID=2014 RepID=UPI00362E33C7